MPRPPKIVFVAACLFLMAIPGFYACKKHTTSENSTDPLASLHLPATPFNYANQPLPNYLLNPAIRAQDNEPASNAVTDWGATLGRVLFYDKILSINNTISCASCHKQSHGFSDELVLSKGFAGGSTGRHSMSLINARYYPSGRFFWDERAVTLEAQTLIPLQDHIEMGMNLDTLIKRLQAKTHYPVLFEKAFGNKNITSEKVAAALSQFVRSIISYQSKFDEGRRLMAPPQDPILTPYSNFTAQENLGKQLFFSAATACNTCHGTETFTAPAARNNGIDNPSTDAGVGGITHIPAQDGNFKVPSLKSIALTAPYMHDGRFATLEQVVEHYNSGIKAHPNLAPQLRNPDGTPRRLNLSADQKAALVAFLHTLTDPSISTDEKFSDPFN